MLRIVGKDAQTKAKFLNLNQVKGFLVGKPINRCEISVWDDDKSPVVKIQLTSDLDKVYQDVVDAIELISKSKTILEECAEELAN